MNENTTTNESQLFICTSQNVGAQFERPEPITCCFCGTELPNTQDWRPCKVDGCKETLCPACHDTTNVCPAHYTPVSLEEKHRQNLAEMTMEKAIKTIRAAGKILGNEDYLSAEHQMNLIAEWLENQSKEASK